MKWLREEVEIIVYFKPGKVKPVCFKYEGVRKNICRINRAWEERRNLHTCQFFLCQLEDDRMAELRWDIDDKKWYLEKY